VTKNGKLASPFAGFHWSWQNPLMIESSRRDGHLDSRLRATGLRPRDLGDRAFTVVRGVPIASVS
jgi:hypothetical protein